MPFPESQDAMLRRGYVFGSHARCNGCLEAIEWWSTPEKKRIPMNPMPLRSSAAISHFVTCKQRQLFAEKP